MNPETAKAEKQLTALLSENKRLRDGIGEAITFIKEKPLDKEGASGLIACNLRALLTPPAPEKEK